MNLILFHPGEISRPLPLSDPRARHLLDVLRRQPGDTFDAGLIDGPRGRGKLEAVGADSLQLSFRWGEPPAALAPLILVVSLPRPQTARDILRDCSTLGVGEMHFVLTEKGEPSYASSTLWRDGEWTRLLVAGVQQAFDTRLPRVTCGRKLAELLPELPAGGTRLALDNYEASAALANCPTAAGTPVVLAVGGERGWSAADRQALRDHGFALVHLGRRVLRTETACVAAITLLRSRFGWL